MKQSMTWQILASDLITGEGLFVGKWRVAMVTYRDHAPENDRKKYLANSSLPGLPSHLGEFELLEDAKQCVEQNTKLWFGYQLDSSTDRANSDQNTIQTNTKRKLAEMSALDRRFFMLGACLVASVLCIFKPEKTANALKKLMQERT